MRVGSRGDFPNRPRVHRSVPSSSPRSSGPPLPPTVGVQQGGLEERRKIHGNLLARRARTHAGQPCGRLRVVADSRRYPQGRRESQQRPEPRSQNRQPKSDDQRQRKTVVGRGKSSEEGAKCHHPQARPTPPRESQECECKAGSDHIFVLAICDPGQKKRMRGPGQPAQQPTRHTEPSQREIEQPPAYPQVQGQRKEECIYRTAQPLQRQCGQQRSKAHHLYAHAFRVVHGVHGPQRRPLHGPPELLHHQQVWPGEGVQGDPSART